MFESWLKGQTERQRQRKRFALAVCLIACGLIITLTGRIGFGMGIVGFGLAYFIRLIQKRLVWPPATTERLIWLRPVYLHRDKPTWHDLEVVKGPFSGAKASELSLSQLQQLYQTLGASIADQRLLEAYFERRTSARAHDTNFDDTATGRAQRTAVMTRQEAYQILGLESGASELAIRKAHRRLIKTLHPDTGGTHILAARVNAAKDLLLK